MEKKIRPFHINSITELHDYLGLKKNRHPLISVVNLVAIPLAKFGKQSVTCDFYSISLYKQQHNGKIRYGQDYYHLDEGVMTFFSPKQVITTEVAPTAKLKGWWLAVHPDFFLNFSLHQSIHDFNYFSYAVNHALHLSDNEEKMVETIMKNIIREYDFSIDDSSHPIIISHIELLLNYCNRFYRRQFITQKHANNLLLAALEKLLSEYFESEKLQQLGPPTVKYISEQLHISPNYLSDMLRAITGESTQQHIHNKLIEKAKEMLADTSLSVSECAYQLGFDYPQSFSKLFKSKTRLSPLEFRNSFN